MKAEAFGALETAKLSRPFKTPLFLERIALIFNYIHIFYAFLSF
jgi:hypothetical protein